MIRIIGNKLTNYHENKQKKGELSISIPLFVSAKIILILHSCEIFMLKLHSLVQSILIECEPLLSQTVYAQANRRKLNINQINLIFSWMSCRKKNGFANEMLKTFALLPFDALWNSHSFSSILSNKVAINASFRRGAFFPTGFHQWVRVGEVAEEKLWTIYLELLADFKVQHCFTNYSLRIIAKRCSSLDYCYLKG